MSEHAPWRASDPISPWRYVRHLISDAEYYAGVAEYALRGKYLPDDDPTVAAVQQAMVVACREIRQAYQRIEDRVHELEREAAP
jgi:hypothetical protein